MKKAERNRRSHTAYTKIKGHKITIFAVVVSLLMIIQIPMASTSTTIRIIAIKPLPSEEVYSAVISNDKVEMGEVFDLPSHRLPNLSEWLNGTGINATNVTNCFIDKNIENNESEVMMTFEIENQNVNLTLSSFSVDTNCSFLDIRNYRILKELEDGLDSIENTTSNNRKTLQDLNETRITLQDLNYRLGSFKNETNITLKNFQSTSKNLQNTSDEFLRGAKNLDMLLGLIFTLMAAILFALIGLFITVGRQDTKKRRR